MKFINKNKCLFHDLMYIEYKINKDLIITSQKYVYLSKRTGLINSPSKCLVPFGLYGVK